LIIHRVLADVESRIVTISQIQEQLQRVPKLFRGITLLKGLGLGCQVNR